MIEQRDVAQYAENQRLQKRGVAMIKVILGSETLKNVLSEGLTMLPFEKRV